MIDKAFEEINKHIDEHHDNFIKTGKLVNEDGSTNWWCQGYLAALSNVQSIVLPFAKISLKNQEIIEELEKEITRVKS